MTMVAFTAHPDHVEICTDSLSYTPSARHIGRSSKVSVLADLDAAYVCQGDGTFSALFEMALAFADGVNDFEGLVDFAREQLPQVWATRLAEVDSPPSEANAFVLGRSDRAGRFRAVCLASSQGFEPIDIPTGRLFCIPPPPPALLPGVPASDDDWADLARLVRRTRSLAPVATGKKVLIGGRVIVTRLEVGAVTQRTIHTFDDTGAEFAQMMAGTLHPVGQRGPCACGSGLSALDCCLAAGGDPCPCGSSRAFAECCRVEPAEVDGASPNLVALSAP